MDSKQHSLSEEKRNLYKKVTVFKFLTYSGLVTLLVYNLQSCNDYRHINSMELDIATDRLRGLVFPHIMRSITNYDISAR